MRIEGHIIPNQKILELQLPQYGKLVSPGYLLVAERFPKQSDIVIFDAQDAPVVRHMILRRLTVAFADHQIVFVKEPVICFYLAGQSEIVVQVAFDLIAGQPVRYRHYITDRSAYALFLINADLVIGCLQVRDQNIPNGLVVHKCLLWCQSNHSVKYPVRRKCPTGYDCPYAF